MRYGSAFGGYDFGGVGGVTSLADFSLEILLMVYSVFVDFILNGSESF